MILLGGLMVFECELCSELVVVVKEQRLLSRGEISETVEECSVSGELTAKERSRRGEAIHLQGISMGKQGFC